MAVFFLGVFAFFSCHVREDRALSFFTFAADLPRRAEERPFFEKKKFDFPLDNLLRKRLNGRPFPLHGGVSISKFFDSHLICAIDTVSVQYNKPLPTVSLLRTDLFFVRVLLGEESK